MSEVQKDANGDAPNAEETIVTPTEGDEGSGDGSGEGDENPLDTETDVEKLREIARAAIAAKDDSNKKLFERVKKAEGFVKQPDGSWVKAPKPNAPASTATPTKKDAVQAPSVEETVLRSQGMPAALLKELKAVAAVRGLDLIDAQADPLFVAIKAEHEKKAKAAEASLGASKGSGGARPKKDASTPNLSEAEHRKLVAEAQAS